MIHDRKLKHIFIVSMSIAIVFPLFSIKFIYPSFMGVIIQNTEDEAMRTGRHLANMLLKSDQKTSTESVAVGDDFEREAHELMIDYNLKKIKVFSPSGQVIFSSSKKDIGKINEKQYFHEIVAQGKPYTKVVEKDTESLEGQLVSADVVETYVPVLRNSTFLGAFELYYDITARMKELNSILIFASITPFALMLVFITVVMIILTRAEKQKVAVLTSSASLRYKSPVYSMVAMAVSIFIAELFAMWFISTLRGVSPVSESLIDSTLLVMFVTPVLYFFFFQPLMKIIGDLRRTEVDLNHSQKLLADEHSKLRDTFKKVEIAKKQWERTMDCMADMIILTDHKGIIKRVNRSVTEFVKMPYQKILGMGWEDFIQENGFESTKFYSGNMELYHKSTQKWFELGSYPFKDEDFSGSVITLHENTELKNVTDELENVNNQINEHRDKLKSALDEVARIIQIVTSNSDTSIRISNPGLKTCYEVKNCGKEDCPCYGRGATRCWQKAGTYCAGEVQGQFAQKYGNCTECNVFIDSTPDSIYEIGEQFNNMMHVIEMKNQELQEAYDELKGAQAQMLQREKMASIGQLAAGVAHEINNPMGFISSNLGTLGKYVSRLTEFINAQSDAVGALKSAETEAQLKDIRKKLKLDYIVEDIGNLIRESLDGSDRVKQIVQNLKSFSRVDEAEYKMVDVNECIESTLNIVWNELKYKATIEKEYGEIPLTKCYPQQLNQVFMNLLVNGAQAIEKQGEIRIKTWNGDKYINISISDTGEGIPEEKLGKIFDPFFTTKEVGKGTGLGLSITYEIIKKHNGDITVESEAGKGTTFTVKIPVLEGK